MSTPASGHAAPGKLMLAGEYAVLMDPAEVPGAGVSLAAAVGRVAQARWLPGGPQTLQLEAFDTTRTWPLDSIPDEGLMGFIAGALSAVAAERALPSGRLEVSVAGQVAGRKLGLGSSAATTVAVLRASLAATGLGWGAERVAAEADAVHLRRQGGRGSGYDIHTIARGGCVAYERATRRGTALPWPAGLFGAALYSGQPASTVAALRRGIGPETPGIPDIAAACAGLRSGWPGADVSALLDALRDCEAGFDALAGVHPWLVPEALAHTRQHIEARGAVARTSGAGGGDCVLAFSDDPERIDRLVEAWPQPCAARLPLDLAPAEAP